MFPPPTVISVSFVFTKERVDVKVDGKVDVKTLVI
jgi:hypothetical protein